MLDLDSKVRLKLSGHSKEVFYVDFDSTGKILFAASKDKTVSLWNTETGEKIRSIEHPRSLYAASLSADGKTLATGGLDIKVRIWDTITGDLLRSFSHQGAISTIQFNHQGTILSASGDNANRNEERNRDVSYGTTQESDRNYRTHCFGKNEPSCSFSPGNWGGNYLGG